VQINHRNWLLAASAVGLISLGLGGCQGSATKDAKSAQSNQQMASQTADGSSDPPPPPPADGNDPQPALASGPNAVCTNSDNLYSVTFMILEAGAKLNPPRKDYIEGQMQHQLSINGVVVSHYDPSVKKVTCEGQLKADVPDSDHSKLNWNDGVDNDLVHGQSTDITWTVQPTADGTDSVIGVVDIDPYAKAISVLADDHFGARLDKG
jgi:hypothetical protein